MWFIVPKSLLGTSLSFVFAVVAYITYLHALLSGNTGWMIVSALVYFFPVFVEFIEELQNTRFNKKWQIILMSICALISLVCMIMLFVYLSIETDGNDTISKVWKIILAVCPVACIPLKAYPMMTAFFQWYNRNIDKQ
jgi:Kef-type K+ transport system membrane component KefB